jgi:DNA (cytosine-5)-methyltransferase 1
MKQLGNSVAVDAIYKVGKNMIDYMEQLDVNGNNDITMAKRTLNKGEWAEPFAFLKIIHDKKIYLSDKDLQHLDSYLDVEKVTNSNINYDFIIFDGHKLIVKNKLTKEEKEHEVSSLINDKVLEEIRDRIDGASGTFEVPEFSIVEKQLGVAFEKGGTSAQKADVILDFNYNGLKSIKNEGFGIKSLMGSKPTLLNASSNTNFIYSVNNFPVGYIDEVNSIDTRKKIMDRLTFINEIGGSIGFSKTEKEVLNYNLCMVDSHMPVILGEMLLFYFQSGISEIQKLVHEIFSKSEVIKSLNFNDVDVLIHKVKQLLLDYTCGFFPGKKWDGTYTSNGTIVVDSKGNLHGFHIVDMESFKDYLYYHTKFDTPSSGRHGFGSVFKERNGQLFFKLNLQLRYL